MPFSEPRCAGLALYRQYPWFITDTGSIRRHPRTIRPGLARKPRAQRSSPEPFRHYRPNFELAWKNTSARYRSRAGMFSILWPEGIDQSGRFACVGHLVFHEIVFGGTARWDSSTDLCLRWRRRGPAMTVRPRPSAQANPARPSVEETSGPPLRRLQSPLQIRAAVIQRLATEHEVTCILFGSTRLPSPHCLCAERDEGEL